MTTGLHPSALATPVPPPIPDLVVPLTPDALADGLRAFSRSYYANHPFRHRCTKADHAAAVAGVGGQSARVPAAVPRKDAPSSNCPDPDVRRVWLQRPRPRWHRAGLWRIDGFDWARRRFPGRDGGRAACCRACGSRLKPTRPLQDEALDRRRRLVTDGAVRARSMRQRIGRSTALPWIRPTRSTTSRAG
jgi:hypothetical protein